MVCGFIGEPIVYEWEYFSLMDKIVDAAEELIEQDGKTIFLIGTSGRFSKMAFNAAKSMYFHHPGTNYYRVLPFRSTCFSENCSHFYTPEEVLNARPYTGLHESFKWIVNNSDVIISYIKDIRSKPATYVRFAAEQGKTVISLGKCTF